MGSGITLIPFPQTWEGLTIRHPGSKHVSTRLCAADTLNTTTPGRVHITVSLAWGGVTLAGGQPAIWMFNILLSAGVITCHSSKLFIPTDGGREISA